MPQPVKLIALLKAKPGMSRVNIAIEEYQEIEGQLPCDGTAELWWDSLEELKEDFASLEGQKAGADGDLFTVVRAHIYTREHIIK